MGTLTSLEKLYDNIKKSNGRMNSAQVRSETERYTANVTGGFTELDIFYTMFDDAFAGSPDVHRFSKDERAQRRQVSSLMRQAMINYAGATSIARNMPGIEPWLQSILLPASSMDEFTENNADVVALFSPDSQAGIEYKQNCINKLMRNDKSLSPEDAAIRAEQDIKKQRGETIAYYVKESANILNELDKLGDLSGKENECARIFGRVMSAKRVNESIGKFLEMADNGTISLSEENRAVLVQQQKQQKRFTMAASKLESMANPMYEYFDVDKLGAYDMKVIRTAWNKFRKNEDAAWRDGKRRKHTHFDAYVTEDIHDNFSNFIDNAADYNEAKREISVQQIQDALKSYSFEPRLASLYSEVPSRKDSPEKEAKLQNAGAKHTQDGYPDTHIYNDKPIAYHQGCRTIIFSPADTMTGVTTGRPEQLYNYAFRGTADVLAKAIDNADRWYKTNKHGYGSMKSQLQEIMRMGALKSSCTPEDIKKRRDALESLLKSSGNYLSIKGRNNNGRDDVERARIEAVRKAETFAKMKIKELDLISSAQATAARYENYNDLSPEQLREITAEENKSRDMADAIRADDKIARGEDPAGWLHKLYSKEFTQKEQIPNGLATQLEYNLYDLESCWDGTEFSKTSFTMKQLESICEFSMGAATAVEIILAERKQLNRSGGPFETCFANASHDDIIDLGKNIAAMLNNGEELNLGNVKSTLQNFDPRDNAMQYIKGVNFLRPVAFEKDMTARYLSNIQPSDNPQCDNILLANIKLHIIMDNMTALKGGLLDKTPAEGNQLRLAWCVARDTVVLERIRNGGKAPGKLEQEMINDSNAFTINIMNSPKFRERVEELDQAEIDTLTVLTGNEVRKFAEDYINHRSEKLIQQGENKKPQVHENQKNINVGRGGQNKEVKKGGPIA